jgi:hypothetical protein
MVYSFFSKRGNMMLCVDTVKLKIDPRNRDRSLEDGSSRFY